MTTALKQIDNIVPQMPLKRKSTTEFMNNEENQGKKLEIEEKFIDSDDQLIYRKRLFGKNLG